MLLLISINDLRICTFLECEQFGLVLNTASGQRILLIGHYSKVIKLTHLYRNRMLNGMVKTVR